MNKAKYFDPFIAKLSRLVALGALGATIFLAEQTAQAQQWRFDPLIRVGYEFDDNAPLAVNPDSTDEIQGYILEGSVLIGAATERTVFDLTPMIRSRNYDEERFDSDDGFLKLNFNHEGLKSNFRVRGNYAQESVRTAERTDADPDINDPDEIPGDDSGRVFAIGDRERFWIFPQWSYDFSEKTSIAAAIRYTDVDYEDTPIGVYTPFTDLRYEVSLTRGFSTRTRGYIRASAGTVENDFELLGITNEVDGAGLSIGIERGLTETMRFRAEVGVVETEAELGGIAVGESDTDAVWDLNLVRDLESVTLLAQIRRSVNSDGAGRVTLRDTFNLSMTKQFSERLEGGLGIRAYSTDQLSSDTIPFEGRDYAQFRAQLSYALSRTFLVEAEYRYTHLDRATVSENAKSNNVFLWLTWQPTGTSADR
jgi:hypothetical protein